MLGNNLIRRIWFSFVLALGAHAAVAAQPSAFNFQGFLSDGGVPANGVYDLQFKLFNAIAGGSQVGATLDRPNTTLVNGIFSVRLDFGGVAFLTSGERFLEISLRAGGSPNAFVVLGARQQILSVPFAVRADWANVATQASEATNATNAQNAAALGGVAPAEYVRRNVPTAGDLKATGNLEIGGNAKQPNTAYGLPKAMLYVNGGVGAIYRCYNGVTGASTGNCGFSVIEAPGLLGVYKIDFGFDVSDRFVVVTAKYGAAQNLGANFRFFNSTTIDVFTFFSDVRPDTARADFMIVVY